MKQSKRRKIEATRAGAQKVLSEVRKRNLSKSESRKWQKVWDDLQWEQDLWRERMNQEWNAAWQSLLLEQACWVEKFYRDRLDIPIHEATGTW